MVKLLYFRCFHYFVEPASALYFKDREEWRQWLAKNHDTVTEVWLAYYKKSANMPGISISDAVEEAICFGWIDGKLKKIDEQRFILKFTPRKKNSVWSKINKDRAIELIRSGKMTQPGLDRIEEAKKNGKWDSAYSIKKRVEIPPDLKGALMENETAWHNFINFANTYRGMYVRWVEDAKRPETREKRIKGVVSQALNNKKLFSDD